MAIDSHAHVNDGRLDGVREEILSSFGSNGVESIVEVGFDVASSRAAVELARTHERVYAAVGVHPHDAKGRKSADYDYFTSVASDPKVVAIGEIGLDYYYDLSERAEQKKALAEQIELADSVGLPIVVHLRDAYADLAQVLADTERYLSRGILLHCYMGSAEYARELLRKYDVYFAFGGAITFKNAKKDDIVRAIPRDRLLIETDCPYMTPVPYRGQPNRPEYVKLVAAKMAEILGISAEEAEETTRKNTLAFFTKMKG